MTPAEQLMVDVLHRTLKPKTRQNTWSWAYDNVRLDGRFTARPGPYDVEFTPYMKGPHEWFSDPRVREITGCKSRQVGGTTYLANCLMYAVGEDPGPCLYVTSTGDNAQSFSEREWTPRVDLSPLLSSLKPDNPDDYKKKEMHFKTCTVKFTGSNSPANLMSRAIRYLFEDEIDTWPNDNGDEAPSLDVVEACTLSYAHAKKILRVSTPTVPTGAVWQYFLRGSQHKFHVPCPHCDHRFEMSFEQLDFHRDECRDDDRGEWDKDKVVRLTTLKCPSCSKHIEQRQQTEMVSKGEWVQTNPFAPKDHISWHISALYSPTVTWGQIAKIFLDKKDTPGGLHDFFNHYLGLPFIRRSTSITIEDIEKVQTISPKYRLYTGSSDWICPKEFKLILTTADVQGDGFWWAQRGVCLDESSYLVDYGPAAAWSDLMGIVQRVYKLPSGGDISSYTGLIDSGWIAKRVAGVYDFCQQSGGLWMPIQGRSVVHGMFAPIREAIFEHKGQFINGVQIRDDLFKEELYIRRIKQQVGPGWYLPEVLDEYYRKQLIDEQLKEKKTARGTMVMEWTDTGNNHLGDVEKYMLGAIHMVAGYLRSLRETADLPEDKGAPSSPEEGRKLDRLRVGENYPSHATEVSLREAVGYIPRTPQESVRLRVRSD